jgi:quinoprotein glucose dehydrogenase
MKQLRSYVCAAAVLAAALFFFATLSGQSPAGPKGPALPTAEQPYTTWSDYGGSADSMQYSALKQIGKSNVGRLERVWFYPVPDRKGNFSFNPIVVDNVMYVLGTNNAIVALDAATGSAIWSHTPEGGSPGSRGISYWESKDRSDRRLIFAAGGALREIDARTGAAIKTFGNAGRVDMREGELRPLGGPSGTPGRVFEDLYLTGSNTGEGFGSPPGDLRAFDIRTGRLVWTFHTIPYPGEYGYDTWPEGAYKWAGGANTWGEISVDQRRGIAYFPLGSPTHDSYGGDRKGDNLFGNSLLALDARTGKRLWHFQTVHHDTWDYDLTTAPKLLTVRHNGKPVDIVAQPTKTGLLFVFDRVTGRPLWPIEERRVPVSDVPGEELSPTQPFPTKPPPFARLEFTIDDINPYVDEAEKHRLRETLRNARNEGLFTPQTLTRDQISAPGEFGGANWAGAAGDPETGWLYVRTTDMPAIHKLRAPGVGVGNSPAAQGRAVYQNFCEACHDQPTAPNSIRSYDRVASINLAVLGSDHVRNIIRTGQGQMPAHPESVISAQQLDWLMAYLSNPAAATAGRGGSGAAPAAQRNPSLPFIQGLTRYTGPLGSVFRASNGLPAIGPPWASIVAYDLNEGVIKWRSPLGIVRALAAKGIKDTGNPVRTYRNGIVATAGGLIFVGTNGDGYVRAFDKDTGRILWEHDLNANPEGIPSVYELNGRQYVAFCASFYGSLDPGNISTFQGKIENQGYYVFALPEK